MTSYPDTIEQWPDQWNRLVNSQGEPVPKRSSKNGKTAEELETWADNCAGKISYYTGKASGDGFWESKVHWFELRVASLREDASVLRKEGPPAKARVSHYTPYSVSGRPAMTSSAIRPLYPNRPTAYQKSVMEGTVPEFLKGDQEDWKVQFPQSVPTAELPFGATSPPNTQAEKEKMEKCFPPFRPPRKMEVDLSAFSISKTEADAGKLQAALTTPPSSPSQEE